MSRKQPPLAVLDADIIFSRVLHELMGRVAGRLRLLDLVWSQELLDEAKQSLIEKKKLPESVAARWVDYLSQGFPTGEADIEAAAVPAEVNALTKDPGDRHVCALAVVSGARYLFTHDRGYLKEGLRQHGVEVIVPDSFLTAAFDTDPDGFLATLEVQASGWLADSRSKTCSARWSEPEPAASLKECARRWILSSYFHPAQSACSAKQPR